MISHNPDFLTAAIEAVKTALARLSTQPTAAQRRQTNRIVSEFAPL
jgi:hypothetical protein